MSLLFRILYATHARGTHHKLALDALLHLDRPDAEAWRSVFLAHAERFMTGAKAPDDTFKDFKNHVLHPGDGFWGGAPQAVRKWYGDLVTALARQDWSEAAWCAGVLSHYYTDPIHPFHTAQSVAENNVHRAVEWSINRAYDSLRAEGLAAGRVSGVASPEGDDWLGDLVRAGAVRSNRHYQALIVNYDFAKGVADPPAGLNATARSIVADLLIYAASGFAIVLDRAISEARVAPPDVSLTARTVLAAITIPHAMLLKKLANDSDRRTVRAMFEELQATGVVTATLPEDDRIVRELHTKEVSDARLATPEKQTSENTLSTAPVALTRLVEEKQIARPESRPPQPPAVIKTPTPTTPAERVRLTLDDALVEAPSIGPKTAARFSEAGIRTVADFIAADPAATAKKLDASHISARHVSEWQAQARLVLSIPGLNGTQAQLLTGAGFDTVTKLAATPSEDVCIALLKFAGTDRGQRVLRSGQPPDVEKIKAWVTAATAARAA